MLSVRIRRFVGLLVIVFVAGAGPPARAQHLVLDGHVIDAETRAPLPGVNVFLAHTSVGAATDAEGYYAFTAVRPGPHTVVASMVGYAPRRVEVTLAPDQAPETVDIRTEPAVYALDQVAVTAERPRSWRRHFKAFEEHFPGTSRNAGEEEKLWFFAGGRMYQNLSNVLWLAGPKKLAKNSKASDALMADILAGIDTKRYRSAKRPPWARLRMLRVMPRVLWRLRSLFGNMFWAILAPERAHRAYQQKAEAHEATFTDNLDYSLPLDVFRRTYTAPHTRYVFNVTMAAVGVGLAALG